MQEREPSLTFIRVGLVIAVPFVIVWTVLATMATGIAEAVWYTRNSVLEETDALRRYWRGGWAEISRDRRGH